MRAEPELAEPLCTISDDAVDEIADMKLANYLRRIAVAEAPKADLATLAMIMASHSRAIAFENFDVVQRKPISMAPADVERLQLAHETPA